jgi:hypothetical protein
MEIAKLTAETLNKSFTDSKAALLSLLGVSTEVTPESLEKAKKGGKGEDGKLPFDAAPAEDEDEDDEKKKEDEDDEDDEDDEEVKKSLETLVSEDVDAEAAMDVEPFLRQLVKSIDERISGEFARIDRKIAKLQKSMSVSVELQKATAQYAATSGDLQKSMYDTIEKIGGQPVPSNSLLKSRTERFPSMPQTPTDNSQILQKAVDLCKEGRLQVLDVTKIEGRLNKGLPLGEYEKFFNGGVQ